MLCLNSTSGGTVPESKLVTETTLGQQKVDDSRLQDPHAGNLLDVTHAEGTSGLELLHPSAANGRKGRRYDKRCQHPVCMTRACFGVPGGPPSHCSVHRLEGMRDVINKKCQHPEGCSTLATYGIPGSGGGGVTHCSRHRLEGMKDLISRVCRHPDCDRQPSYGDPGGGPASHCAQHKLDGMKNVVSKMCKDTGCDKRAYFGFPGGPASYCMSHKLDGMSNVLSKKCQFPSCKNYPKFRFPGQHATHCAEHQLEGMEGAATKRRKMTLSHPNEEEDAQG